MVVRIRKKAREGPKGHYAVPLALVLAALFGSRREVRPYRQPIQDPTRLRGLLAQRLGLDVVLADRPLTAAELADWALGTQPGRLAEMFGRSRVIPMGPPTDDDTALGVLPLLALGRGQRLGELDGILGQELPEVTRVAIERELQTAFGMIPGYDALVLAPPVHLRDLNRAIEWLNAQLQAEYDRAGVAGAARLVALPSAHVEAIPLQAPYNRDRIG